ncbi:MAG: hypothetical protein DMG40_01030 [Acidobacteria bacterium]|nr:MAG: hypothetical protein DMG40_01030 [Acidobacteriota bacterium]
MRPEDLKPEQFNAYPPEARKLALEYLETFRRLPLSFLPSLLREVIEFDFKFPAERRLLEKELANLGSLSQQDLRAWFREFTEIKLSESLEKSDWVASPAQFVERLSAHLWTTHQMDAFRHAAVSYADKLRTAVAPELPASPRFGIAVIGQGVDVAPQPLFRKLRPYGAYFSAVNPENGLKHLFEAIASRANANPAQYAHWYIDGGEQLPHPPTVTCVSYKAMEQVRVALLARIHAETQKGGMGPEALRTLMAQLQPTDLGMAPSGDPVLNRFQIKLLTEGSGTQIFSTSFVQWAAREALRRAEPLTLLVRFAPRQRQKPMNELLSPSRDQVELDPSGSLVDADMGAYYNWIDQQRLPGSEKSLFLAWFENQKEAVAISPVLPRGTVSNETIDLRGILSWMA